MNKNLEYFDRYGEHPQESLMEYDPRKYCKECISCADDLGYFPDYCEHGEDSNGK